MPRPRKTPKAASDSADITVRLFDDAPPVRIPTNEDQRQIVMENADRKRISMNAEIRSCIDDAIIFRKMTPFLFGEEATLNEILILREFLLSVKRAAAQAGINPASWYYYANSIDFAFDSERWGKGIFQGRLDVFFDVDAMAAPIRERVETVILGAALSEIVEHGAPRLYSRTSGNANDAAMRLGNFARACDVLVRLSAHEHGLKDRYQAIYAAAGEFVSEHRYEPDIFDEPRFAGILTLAQVAEAE